MTVRFQVIYVFLAMEVGSRRILHYNVTAHPTADWTLQQFREAIPSNHPYQFLIHDRDSIFSPELDEELNGSFGLRVLRTPVRAPKANAYCERLIGTVRRECLDFMIPLNERHLRRSCVPGSRTITKDAHTPAWARAFPRKLWIILDHDQSRTDIDCHVTVRSGRGTSWAAYIMNIGWNRALREPSKVFADDSLRVGG